MVMFFVYLFLGLFGLKMNIVWFGIDFRGKRLFINGKESIFNKLYIFKVR